MEETKNNLQEKFISFLSENSNFILIVILIFALILRIKYLTINQAVWYDEAEYLASAKAWAFGTPYELHFVRPVLLPFIFAIFYKFGASELFLRVIILVFSLVGILLTYLVGKELVGNTVALIATFMLSSSYVHVFYTARLLTDIPSLTLWLISIWFFWKGYVKNENKIYFWWFGLFFILAVLMKFPAGLLGIIIILYLLLSEGLNFIKNRNLWIAGLIMVIIFIPYGFWYYFTYNKIPIIGVAGFYHSVNYLNVYLTQTIPMILISPIPVLSGIFPSFGNFLIIFLIVGSILLLFNLLLGYNLVRKNEELKRHLFILFWLFIPIIYFSFLAGQVPEDRYLFYSYPATFYLIGFVFVKIYKRFKKINTLSGVISAIILFVIITSIAIQNLQTADNLIKLKSNSYIQFRQSGTWIKENSFPEQKVIATGVPQLSYYSERKIIYWPEKKEFERLLKEDKDVRYLVLSVLEGSPQWTYVWPQENQDKVVPVQAYLDQQQRPILIVYEVIR